MKKRFLFSLLVTAFLTLSGEARELSIMGKGSGGTTHGDREAACGRAYERAENDALDQCDLREAYATDIRQGSCGCRRKPGSRDEYSCDATVRLSCEV